MIQVNAGEAVELHARIHITLVGYYSGFIWMWFAVNDTAQDRDSCYRVLTNGPSCFSHDDYITGLSPGSYKITFQVNVTETWEFATSSSPDRRPTLLIHVLAP